jgi:hypothetical protein
VIKQCSNIENLEHENTILHKRIENLTYPYEGLHLIHFSMDDVIEIFKDLTINEDEYQSIFDNKTLRFFRDLHLKYGLVLSCYCYFDNKNGFQLSRSTCKFKEEFERNSDWLKFGFHGYNKDSRYETEYPLKAVSDYDNVISALIRIVGDGSIDRIPRIHMYQGNKEVIRGFQNTEFGILGLLSADDDRKSYYFDEQESIEIRNHDLFRDSIMGLTIYPTDMRMENSDIEEKLKEISSLNWIDRNNVLIFFTHEWALNKENKRKIIQCCDFATMNNYKFEFLINDDIGKVKLK